MENFLKNRKKQIKNNIPQKSRKMQEQQTQDPILLVLIKEYTSTGRRKQLQFNQGST